MKKKNLLIIGLILVLFTNICTAQKVKYHEFTFKYKQLPLQPLGKDVETYLPKVMLGYIDISKSIEENYNKELKAANERYQKELIAYNKKTTAEKVVSKEILKENPPVFIPIEKPFVPKLHNTNELESKYIVLENYKKGNANPVFITATVNNLEFQNLVSEEKSRQKTVDGIAVTEQYTVYSISYSQSVYLNVEKASNSAVLFKGIVPYTDNVYSNSYTNIVPLDYKEQIENQIIKKSMNLVYDFINDNYAFREMSLSSEITYPEHKKYNYMDYTNALEIALSGYNTLYSDKMNATEKLKNAIAIWEKALNEYNPNSNKARVNAKVGVSTMMNIAEANLFIDNFEECEKYLTKASINNPTDNQMRRINFFRNYLTNFRERYHANL